MIVRRGIRSWAVFAILACGLPACVREVVVHRAHACVLDAAAGVEIDVPPTPQDVQIAPDAPADVVMLSPLLATGTFTDQTEALGAAFALDPGSKGAGKEPASSIGLFVDLDRDGLMDFVATDGVSEVRWGRAVQPWKWIKAPLLDVKGEGVRCLAATDVDGDGYPEIIIGGNGIRYMVRGKGETYTEESQVRGLVTTKYVGVESVTPVDLDADGLLDLAVGEYDCEGKSHLRAFVNQGNGHYAEKTKELGMEQVAAIWAVLATDFDGDRRPDLMSVKEGCATGGGNGYFHGTEGGYVLTNLPPVFQAPKPDGGTPMGGSVGDVDNDGRLDYLFSEAGFRDLWLGGMDMRHPDLKKLAENPTGGNHLLMHQADGSVKSRGLEAGLWLPLNGDGHPMTSWSARLYDFDADGHLDAILSHGLDYQAYVIADEAGARPVLLRNRGDVTFADVSANFGLPAKVFTRAMALADVDGDGDLDLFLGGQTNAPILLRNDVQHGNRSLTVRLVGHLSNPWGLQARLELQTDKHLRVAEMSTQAPASTMDQPIAHFGIPAGEVAQQVTVHWPSGYDQIVQVPAAVPLLVIEEPPLVTLSDRWLHQNADAKLDVQASAFTAQGTPRPDAVVTIELAAGAPGTWLGPTQCGQGTCTRTWKAPAGPAGEAAFAVSVDGKPWIVQPKVRFGP